MRGRGLRKGFQDGQSLVLLGYWPRNPRRLILRSTIHPLQSKARKTHHQTSHLHLRPFVCPHQASTGCTASYGHNHLLQRHLHKRHPDVSSASTQPSPPPKPILAVPATAEQVIGFLTGSSYVSSRQIACPFHGRSGTLVSAGGHDEGCGYRFSRAYDLRRHLGKVHGVEVSEEEGRGMAERLRGEAD